MANNRMYLVCRKCDPGPEHAKALPSRLYLAKYNPSTGWYTLDEDWLAFNMDKWFEEHRHAEGEVISPADKPTWDNLFEPGRRYGTMYGNEHITLQFEEEPDGSEEGKEDGEEGPEGKAADGDAEGSR